MSNGREFSIPVAIKGGLAPEESSAGLEVCVNLKPAGDVLKSVQFPTILGQLTGIEWPFPQMAELNSFVYVLTKDAICKFINNELVVVLNNIPNANYPWSWANIGKYKLFTNNKVAVGGVDTLQILDIVPAGNSVCAVGAQFIVAAPWMYGAHRPNEITWSCISKPDFRQNETNAARSVFVDYCGEILAVKRFVKTTLSGLKQGFAAFGTEGVATFVQEGAPAYFSQVLMSDIGIASRLAVSGSATQLYYVGTDMQLYTLADGKIQPVGYAEHIKHLSPDLAMSYDPAKKEAWISG